MLAVIKLGQKNYNGPACGIHFEKSIGRLEVANAEDPRLVRVKLLFQGTEVTVSETEDEKEPVVDPKDADPKTGGLAAAAPPLAADPRAGSPDPAAQADGESVEEADPSTASPGEANAASVEESVPEEDAEGEPAGDAEDAEVDSEK